MFESLRVLRKGGVHAINDEMGAKLNGDGEDFASIGFHDVQPVDSAQ